MTSFKRAVKHEAKLRMALAGPAGSGKTYTAMTLASALAEGRPFALVDTEHGSASKYADLFAFDVLELDSFHPDYYVEAIHEAEAAGYDVLVIDSLTHAWSGKEGLLEQVERFTKLKYNGNTFRAWADATPIQNRFIDALAGASLHIIATMRSKVEYVVETNERGKASPRKVGMAPIQREGVEYEFDLFGEMDQDNTLVIHKSRCPALSGAVIAKPGSAVADTLKSWLQGVPQPETLQRETPTAHSTESPRREQSEDTAKRVPAEMPAQRKSLTERARELGYEGDAWMALVYRLTGKRDPKLVTAQDKAKLGSYLEHLAAKANLFAVKAETHPPSEDGDSRDIGA
jgi:hypothetical protein